MVALIQSENHAANKGKTAGRYQVDTHPTGILGFIVLVQCALYVRACRCHFEKMYRIKINYTMTLDNFEKSEQKHLCLLNV